MVSRSIRADRPTLKFHRSNILPHFLVILKSSLCNLLLHGLTLDSADESSSDSDLLSSCKSEFDKFFLSRVRLILSSLDVPRTRCDLNEIISFLSSRIAVALP